MADHYKLLGIPEDATTEDIKRAFRSKAFEHHPDHQNNQSDRRLFQELLQAYETLKDPIKRKHYDNARNGILYPPWDSSSYRSGDASWDTTFNDFAKRAKSDFHEYRAEGERLWKERNTAERIARRKAWEREKQAAAANKERVQRILHRTDQARFARHATVMRKFWQSHAGFTWQDAVAGILFLGTTTLVALYWKQYVIQPTSRMQNNTDDNDPG